MRSRGAWRSGSWCVTRRTPASRRLGGRSSGLLSLHRAHTSLLVVTLSQSQGYENACWNDHRRPGTFGRGEGTRLCVAGGGPPLGDVSGASVCDAVVTGHWSACEGPWQASTAGAALH